MKINDLYDAVAGIDDDLIERADAARRGGNASAVRTASAHNTINTGRLTGIAASVIAAVCALATIISIAGLNVNKRSSVAVPGPESTGRVYRNSTEQLIISGTPAGSSKDMIDGYWICMSLPLCVENGGAFQINCALGEDDSRLYFQLTDEELAQLDIRRTEIPVFTEHRDAAEKIIHIKQVQRKRAPPHQGQKNRLLDICRRIVQGQEHVQEIRVKRGAVQADSEMPCQVFALRVRQITEI